MVDLGLPRRKKIARLPGLRFKPRNRCGEIVGSHRQLCLSVDVGANGDQGEQTSDKPRCPTGCNLPFRWRHNRF
ncbi:hypothetical protein [Oryzicola mucosus]|uniref:Uncharacterized protein n=1 Tax=Oryzicola mucosus TaxID=2767425 RepID=A0A8J6Q5S1_9HYPH|nr:hypothetical protein [Oryzicola mucosus]